MTEEPSAIPEPPGLAWLVLDGERIALESPFKIGRSSRCSFQIDDRRASREHALLTHDPGTDRWLLADLGSTNGTAVNGLRLNRPVTLRDSEKISIGDHHFTFRHITKNPSATCTVTEAQTMLDVQVSDRWLLVADVKNSSGLSRELTPEVLNEKLRVWVRECEEVIGAGAGVVNEYTGDGFLAFWREERCAEARIAEVLRTLAGLDSASGLEFRILLHFGRVHAGGAVSSGRDKMAGPEVNFVYKAEKSVAPLDRRVCLTEPAARRIGDRLALDAFPAVEVAGFPGRHRFFGIAVR